MEAYIGLVLSVALNLFLLVKVGGRLVQGKENTNLIFDMALPGELMHQQKEIKKKLDAELNSREGITYHTVITFDMASFNE